MKLKLCLIDWMIANQYSVYGFLWAVTGVVYTAIVFGVIGYFCWVIFAGKH